MCIFVLLNFLGSDRVSLILFYCAITALLTANVSVIVRITQLCELSLCKKTILYFLVVMENDSSVKFTLCVE